MNVFLGSGCSVACHGPVDWRAGEHWQVARRVADRWRLASVPAALPCSLICTALHWAALIFIIGSKQNSLLLYHFCFGWRRITCYVSYVIHIRLSNCPHDLSYIPLHHITCPHHDSRFQLIYLVTGDTFSSSAVFFSIKRFVFIILTDSSQLHALLSLSNKNVIILLYFWQR